MVAAEQRSRRRAYVVASLGFVALVLVALWLQAANPRRPDPVNPIADPGVDPALICPDTNGLAFTGLTMYARPGVSPDAANQARGNVDIAAACQHYIAGGTGVGDGGGTMDFYQEADRGDLELVASLLRETGAFSRVAVHREPHHYMKDYVKEASGE